jgi:hypothetical protein
LYLQGESVLLNPTLNKELISAAYADDTEAARSEWGGLFRQDVSGYLTDDVIDRALCPGERSRPRLIDAEHVGFVDPAGGVAGGDAMTVCVAHQTENGRVVVDQLLAIDPPFDTEQAVSSCALVLKSFGITTAKADRYAGEWPTQSFQRHGIALVSSELDKSAIYREVQPLFVSGLVSLVDDRRLEVELRALERTPRAGGRADAIDHPPGHGSHDDRINAVCGALWMASKSVWLGRSRDAYARPDLHASSLSYDPLARYADELERANNASEKRGMPYGRRH